ncbi:MAG: peptide chain release factor N(5)-glutamine methyltransferase [Candidatus Nomurabacteria bacterium]|jgi:release factor glutamine methyltransferase|nr:peptide chain release factor N(5)-glutamine methyltransferase [Candidatus Nomurabacteria bacterium]
MNISYWLSNSGLDRLDGELLLEFVLGRRREWLLAHDDFEIPVGKLKMLKQLQTRRLNGEPIAYILGKKEFYGRDFLVTLDVLIPRPETENLIEIVKTLVRHSGPRAGIRSTDNFNWIPDQVRNDGVTKMKVLEVGTGSGCIAITLKLERPDLEITASDVSKSALLVARRNWKQLGTTGQKINFIRWNLIGEAAGRFDIIVANLPYVDREWETSPAVKYEPELALFAGDGGLELIKKLLDQAAAHLSPDGYVVLEFDPRQAAEVKKYAEKRGFKVCQELPFALVIKNSLNR